MKYIQEQITATLEVKQSKFIAHLLPFDLYEEILQHLKQEHPKARHFVTAYRYLNEYGQIVESASDDGEPKGTSGKPSLMVLQGQNLINTAVVIVRYFGGTKLGTGGLVRAYSDAVNLVIDKAHLLQYKEESQTVIYFDYSNVRLVEYECAHNNISIVNKKFVDQAIYTIKASKDDLEIFLNKFQRVVSSK
ncbi:IMPACT family protein [Sulfurimonas sp.]